MEQNTSKVFAEASAPAVTTAAGTGSALFVINLCASMAPLAAAAKTLPGLEKYRVYPVSRAEDGRTRYRLRLGFFTSEADAEQALAAVRDQYPTAFTACLADEDRKFARGFLPDSSHNEIAPAPPQMSIVVDNDSTRPVRTLRSAAPAATPKPVAVSVAPAAATPAAPAPALKASADSAPHANPPSAAIDDAVEIEISWEPPAKTAVSASTAQPASPTTAKTEAKLEKAASTVPVTPAAAPTTAPTPGLAAKTPPAIEKTAAPSAVASARSEPASAVAAKPVSAAPTSPAKPVLAATMTPMAKPETAALKPTPVTAHVEPVAAAHSLELVTTSAPLPTPATSTHRGIVNAKAPTLDSIRLTLDTELGCDAPVDPPKTATHQPFHVGKGIELPATQLTLDSDDVAKPAPPQAPKKSPVVTESASKTAASRASAVSYDNLDSTQTIRALTAEELNDESQEKCFAIQLAVSEQPVNLDAMPHLDIFEAYRLYSIATAGSGKITHSLRIGFFREEVSAEAVSGYLRTFFPAPTIVRISLAEQARFKDAPPPKTEPDAAPDPAESKVVALSQARARNTRPTIPTVTMEVATPAHVDTGATGSFKPNATGAFKPNATGSFKTSATGTHKAVKNAAKSAATPTRRSAPLAASKKSATGKQPVLSKKPLSQQLSDEARQVDLSETGIRQSQKSGSLLSRLVGKLSK